MKTRIALYCYYLSISLLTVCAIGIVVKLLFWPPCTQTANTCVIEPWSVAGLAGTVLAVAATVLAVLGAVAVAAWWTSLNERVTDQVKGLYEGHKKEIGKELEDFIAEQQQLVRDQVGTVQTKLQTVESRIDTTRTDIDDLEGLTKAFIDIAEDGIITDLLNTPKTWAEKITTLRKFPKVPFKMAMVYINRVEYFLVRAEKDVLANKDELNDCFRLLGRIEEADQPELSLVTLKQRIYRMIQQNAAPNALDEWEKALYWRDVASQEVANPENILRLNEKISAYQFRIEQLKIGNNQVEEQTKQFYQQADHKLKLLEAEMDRQLKLLEAAQDTSNTASQP